MTCTTYICKTLLLFAFSTMKWCKISFIVYTIRSFLFFTFIGFIEGHKHQQLCNPSSCGGIIIKYPFRLKGDPANCGVPIYELTCSDNKTFWELQSSNFLVKNINYTNKLIKLVHEVGFLRSNCSLPLKPFLANYCNRHYRLEDGLNIFYFLESWSWISLMNCSKKLTSVNYKLINSCLSQKGSYVYGTSSSYASSLAPSCNFLSTIPTSSAYTDDLDLFQAFHDGFNLSWEIYGSTYTHVKFCFQLSWRPFYGLKTMDFLSMVRLVVPTVLVAEIISFPVCIISSTSKLNDHFKWVIYMSMVVLYIIQLVIVLHCIGRLVFAPLTLCIFLALKFWTIKSSEDIVEKFLRSQQSLSPIRYTYAHIITITRHFKEQLGRGGFGSVYKGELPGGHFVAVKLLTGNSKCSGDDFISEVSTIGRIHHLNVVRLVGFCSEGSKRALIYEFMSNKSLDKYIFSSNRSFTWQKLNNIALGVAKGIDYLHRGCDMTILHFDIKPQNILLNQNFLPKIADFGLAKLYPKEYNAVSVSAARGTIGYIAPELVSRNFGVISHKSDVYSFGMLLMEMAAGRRNVDKNAGSSCQNYYPSLIYDKLNNDAKEGIKFESFEMNEVEKKLCLVGLWCIQIRPTDRPSMMKVVQMLEGEVDALELPPKPFFSDPSSIPRTLHSDNTATIELTVIDEVDSS